MLPLRAIIDLSTNDILLVLLACSFFFKLLSNLREFSVPSSSPFVKLYMDITNILLGQTVLIEQTNTSRALNAGPVHRSRLP